MSELFLSWGLLVISVFFNVIGAFSIKWRLNELGPIAFDSVKTVVGAFIFLLKSPIVVIGVILFFVAPVLFTISLSRMDISIAYPASVGLNFLILILLGIFVLGESMTTYKMLGISFVILGLYFLNRTT